MNVQRAMSSTGSVRAHQTVCGTLTIAEPTDGEPEPTPEPEPGPEPTPQPGDDGRIFGLDPLVVVVIVVIVIGVGFLGATEL